MSGARRDSASLSPALSRTSSRVISPEERPMSAPRADNALKQILADFCRPGGLREKPLLDASGFEGGNGVVFHLVMDFNGMAANFTILDKSLAFYRQIEHHRDLFPAVGTCKEVLHWFN